MKVFMPRILARPTSGVESQRIFSDIYKMRTAATDRKILLWLMTALVIETLLLLWHMDVISLRKDARRLEERPAGQVLHLENQLQRRSLNSLVWEKSSRNEAVYFHDSLLTLSQSTAKLDLQQGTEIELSENTLVTIEPPEDNERGEIRLRFNRGGVRTRNPFLPTRIEGDDFSMTVDIGSELQLRQVAEKEFEVRVTKGAAQVFGANGSHAVSPTEVLRLSKGVASALNIDADLRWHKPPPKRIYSHFEFEMLELNWVGEAESLVVQTISGDQQSHDLESGQRRLRLPLNRGNHLFYLRSADASSAPLEVQLWQAPALHLIAPLPRNRVHTGKEVFFLWTRLERASAYEFRLQGNSYDISRSQRANGIEMKFEKEDDAKWSVWAKDEQGFEIPPLYDYPIYLRHEPLPAPRLRAPKLRQPAEAEKGAWLWLWQQLMPRAQADEARYTATFQWDPVDGAVGYWIEISQTPDFRHPLVSVQVHSTDFTHGGLLEQIYYWRVAAAGSDGRMGLFSEASSLNLNSLHGNRNEVDGVKIRRQSPVVSAPVPVATAVKPEPPPSLSPTPSPPAPPPALLSRPRGPRAFWQAGYTGTSAEASQQVKASFAGLALWNVSGDYDLKEEDSRWLRVSGRLSRNSYKPSSEEKYPYQPDLVVTKGRLSLSQWSAHSVWGYGLSADLLPSLSRDGLESVKIEDAFAMTPFLAAEFGTDLEYRAELGAVLSSQGYGARSTHRILISPFGEGLLLGAEIDAYYFGKGEANQVAVDGFLLMGFEF